MADQIRPDALIDLIRGDVQMRYEPNFAFKSIVATYLALPGLRGFWPMSSVAYTNPQGLDESGNVNHLTNNNTSLFGYENLIPYVEFNGTTQYLSKADGGAGNWADVTGGELYIDAANRGLTLGGWFWIDQTTGANQNLIAKTSGVGVARSYLVSYVTATAFPNFTVASGAASTQVDGTAGTTGTVSFNEWYFWCGRFIPSTELKIFLNNNSNTNVAAIPATINDSVAPFTIGANGVPNVYQDGKASMCFLCAAQLSDAIINALFNQTRSMFGV